MIKRMGFFFVFLTLVCAYVLTACNTTTAASPTQMPTVAVPAVVSPTQTPLEKPSIIESLPNVEYLIELASTGKAQLKDGTFAEPAAPGSATKTKIQLGQVHAIGDVNGDGLEDAVVTLVVDPGGSGTFTYLALVINDDGEPKPLAAVLLGDRIIVKSLAPQSGNVAVMMLTREPDEPMSSEPTIEVTRLFKLLGDKLVEEK